MTLPVLPAVPTAEARTAISAEQVEQIERQVAYGLASMADLDALTEWRARAAALEAYLRSRDLQRPMLGAQRRVEGRIGQLLGEPVGQGARTDLSPRGQVDKIDRQRRADFRLLGRALSGDCKLTGEEWRKSRRALLALIRQRLGVTPVTPDLPAGQFNCIVADPPWRLDTGPNVFGGTGEAGHDALAYDQMPLADISGLNIKSLAAPDAHLYLWTTNRYLRDAYSIAESWGFNPSVLLTWCKKPRGVGLGDTFRLTTEFVLFARRGNLPHLRIEPTTWFDWPRGRHSAKPDQFYQLVESVTPGPARLDMFARKQRPGWVVWGDEVETDARAM